MNIFKKKKTTNNQIEEKNLNTEIEMAQDMDSIDVSSNDVLEIKLSYYTVSYTHLTLPTTPYV